MLKGSLDYQDEIINIIDFINLDQYIKPCTLDKLSINKKILYSIIREFKKHKWVYIIVHAYPHEIKNKLKFSDLENDLCESLKNIANELKYSLSLVFSIVSRETLCFEIYCKNKILTDYNLYTKFDEYDSSMWNIEILSNDSYSKAGIYHKNTNTMILIDASDAKKINEWKTKFKEKKLSNLQKIAFENLEENLVYIPKL